ncbi:MAG: DUF3035 domain-containing protein [Acetobacteraceae bacterium]|nr:DUF3035 domain-containing protein [Acetobacteraceae bacterium]
MLGGALLALSGCSERATHALGLTRDAPDEFRVTTRAPLQIPPTFDLPPPRPGLPRPQEQSERRQAEEALVPQLALTGTPSEESPGQKALVAAAGPPAPPNIRALVTEEAALDRPQRSLADRLEFWKSSPPPGTAVDARRESQRLRENSALGQSVQAGDTPVEQHKRESFLDSITNLF